MLVGALAALATGWVLIVLPILAVAIPAAFTTSTWWVIVGALLWGAAVGIQDRRCGRWSPTLVAPNRRASAYGPYAAVLATAGGGALTGYRYGHWTTTLVIVVATVQVLALVFLAVTTSRRNAATV